MTTIDRAPNPNQPDDQPDAPADMSREQLLAELRWLCPLAANAQRLTHLEERLDRLEQRAHEDDPGSEPLPATAHEAACYTDRAVIHGQLTSLAARVEQLLTGELVADRLAAREVIVGSPGETPSVWITADEHKAEVCLKSGRSEVAVYAEDDVPGRPPVPGAPCPEVAIAALSDTAYVRVAADPYFDPGPSVEIKASVPDPGSAERSADAQVTVSGYHDAVMVAGRVEAGERPEEA